MKTLTAFACVVLVAAVWVAAPAVPAGSRQFAVSDLPPLDYSPGSDSQPHEVVPKGTLTKYTLAPGKYQRTC
jgi:hypothetical protein